MMGEQQTPRLRVGVIGAGVAGVCTAWELASDGHQVTVFEPMSGLAEAASFASTGLLAPAGLGAWDLTSPDWMAPEQGAGGWRLWKMAGWTWSRQCRSSRAPERLPEIQHLGIRLGRESAVRLSASLQGLNQDMEIGTGVLLLSPPGGLAAAPWASGLALLKTAEEAATPLGGQDARRIERALATDAPLKDALHLPGDIVINGRQWLTILRNESQRLGCTYQFQTRVTGLEAGGKLHLMDASGATRTQSLDAVVICAGASARSLMEPLGLRLPWLALDHCAITAPVRESLDAPESAVIDAHTRVVIARTGQRIRVSSAEGLAPGASPAAAYQKLYKALTNWFPGAAQFNGQHGSAQEWRATCTHLPDGLPVVGATGLDRIWVHSGHGTRGWTFAPACARVVADQIGGRAPALDAAARSPQRWL
jgi:D-amino-acid dehydrogenase